MQQLPSDEIPPLPSSEQMTKEYEGSFIRVLASIIGVILLVIATFWVLKKLGRGHFGKSGSSKTIQILERRPLSPKTVLFLVQIENKRILLSESQLEVRGLATVEELESEER
jgi:flagellar protein FliO/FliZ